MPAKGGQKADIWRAFVWQMAGAMRLASKNATAYPRPLSSVFERGSQWLPPRSHHGMSHLAPKGVYLLQHFLIANLVVVVVVVVVTVIISLSLTTSTLIR